MKAYCDTSLLVSLYAPDANSARAAALCRQKRVTLLITPLCELELTNAFQLRVYRKEVTATQVSEALAEFQKDLLAGVYCFHPVSLAVYEQAKRLSVDYTARVGARSLDILHLAAAITARSEILYTFDAAQKRLAEAVGFATAPK